MRAPSAVLEELRRRAERGQSLRSGSNRGDWLYAAAVVHFGSWGAAVARAGYDYAAIKHQPLTAAQVLDEVRRLAATGRVLCANAAPTVASAAVRHFGSWRKALLAAGHPDAHLTWSRRRVTETIRQRQARGLAVNPAQVLKDDRMLYVAGRRRFGSWGAAVRAATSESASSPATTSVQRGARRPRRARGVSARSAAAV